MALRCALLAVLALTQAPVAFGSNGRSLPAHTLRGAAAAREASVSPSFEDSDSEAHQSTFLERNLRWIAPVPYFEGKAVSLARRMDLSVLFHNKAGLPTLGDMPTVPPLKKPPVINDQGDIEFDMDKLTSEHPVLDKDGNVRDHTAIIAAVISSASSILVWVGAVLAAAFFYRNYKDISEVNVEKASATFKDQPFANGPFDCFEDTDTCCWAFWCSGVQWADTMSAVGSLSFWIGLTVFLLLQSLNLLTGVVTWVIVALVFMYYRQQLRNKLGMKNEGSDMAKDFAMWCCCACCAIAQEARQVKAARSAGIAA